MVNSSKQWFALLGFTLTSQECSEPVVRVDASAPGLASASVTISSTAQVTDAHIVSGAGNSLNSNGAGAVIYVGRDGGSLNVPVGPDVVRRGLIRFDVSGVPDSTKATVSSV